MSTGAVSPASVEVVLDPAAAGATDSVVVHFFRTPGLPATASEALTRRLQRDVCSSITAIETEFCFNVGVESAAALGEQERTTLQWLLAR